MAADFNWCEDNGAISSSHGTTRTGFSGSAPFPSDLSFKTVDDCRKTDGTGTLYSAASIQAGNRSMDKWPYFRISGTYNSVSNIKFGHTAGAMPQVSAVNKAHLYVGPAHSNGSTPTYRQPTTGSLFTGAVEQSNPISIGSGNAVAVGPTGPEASAGMLLTWSTPNATIYSGYLPIQLVVDSDCPAGDYPSGGVDATLMVQYDEN